MATVAWGLRKCSRAITLMLIFLLAMKPGLIDAVYSMTNYTLFNSMKILKYFAKIYLFSCYQYYELIIVTLDIYLYGMMDYVLR